MGWSVLSGLGYLNESRTYVLRATGPVEMVDLSSFRFSLAPRLADISAFPAVFTLRLRFLRKWRVPYIPDLPTLRIDDSGEARQR